MRSAARLVRNSSPPEGLDAHGGTHPSATAPAITRFVRAALRGYKRFVSPTLPAACRFHPTCSVYAEQAIERHGLLRGFGLAVRRLAKCHPLNPGGFDPVK